MADLTRPRGLENKGEFPRHVTLPIAANVLCYAGTIACRNADGRTTPGADAAGLPATGLYKATFDNRTTAPEGGGAGAILAEIDCGVFALEYTGTAPKTGEVVYVASNHEVSTDSSSGTRGIAGYCVETIGTKCYTWMGPHVVAQIVIAATEASQLDTAQADIDELQADALTSQAFVPVPLAAFTNSGAPLVAFANGTADGLVFQDSEARGFRWNDTGSSRATLATGWVLPPDLDGTAPVVLHFLACRVGSADTTVVLTVTAFFQTVDAAYDADSDCGGNTAALDKATKVVGEYTVSIAAADVPEHPGMLTFTVVPSSALDGDDLILFGCWVEYTRKMHTS